MRPVQVVGVRVELPANNPVVLLKETDGARYLAIWIGAVEASAIAFHQQGITSARPLTHDLLRDVVGALDADLTEVRITEIREEVFYAELVFGSGATVSARPSDAIALALRTETPIVADEGLLDEVGILIPDAGEADDADGTIDAALSDRSGATQERAVEEFREFLDTISPDDFASGGEGSSADGPSGDESGSDESGSDENGRDENGRDEPEGGPSDPDRD